MADANQLKRIEPIDYGEDDPFAELTRIMGFDPRVPVRPAAADVPRDVPRQAVAPAAPVAASQDEPDFDIDLERELFGGLSMDDESPDLASTAASVARNAPEQDAGELDQDFDTAFAMEAGDLDLGLDAVEAANDDVAHDFAGPAATERAEPVMEELPMAADRPEEDFAAAAIGYDAAPAVSAAAASAHRRVDEDIDLDFDLAMAQVDMDFGSPEPAPAHTAGEEADLEFFDEAAFEQALAVEADSVAVEHEPVLAGDDEPACAVESAAWSMPPEDTTLEDELAALLGNPVARAELPGSYDAEPLAAAAPTPVADDLADFEAELAAWQPEDPGDAGSYAAAGTAASDSDINGPVEPFSDDDGYRVEAVGPESGAFDDTFDASAFDAEPEAAFVREGPVAEEESVAEVAVDPLAALRSMAHDAGRGGTSPAFAGYRSLATPTAGPSFAAERPAYRPVAAADYQTTSAYRPDPAPAATDPTDAYETGSAGDAQFADIDDGVPDIETVDVPEHAFAVADDLDLPELAFAVDDAPVPGYDEFERDFAVAYAEPEVVAYAEPETLDDGFAAEMDLSEDADAALAARGFDMAPAAVSTAGAAGWSHASVDRYLDDLDLELDAAAQAAFADIGELEDGFDERPAAALSPEMRGSTGARRGLMIAAIVAGVAMVGGIGAFALSFGGRSGTDVPVVVRADDAPVKVRPANPGGTVVPNQDSKVYQTVTGGVSAPSQEKLITSSEEPVDVAAEALQAPLTLNEDDVAADPAAKGEDRVAATADESPAAEEVAVVAPRKVRTMVVKPDGSLVPREEPVEKTAAAEPLPGAEASTMQPAAALPAAAAVEPAKPKVTKAADSAKAETPKAVEKTRTASIPDAGPLAPSRPADQPVDVVGEVKPEQVAAAGAAGAWSVQIASQPSEEAAKSTYQDLSRRYAAVIGGKGVTIIKADISGKGTFYRVRVPAGSRSDAQALCEKYKAAGGNCFVSK